MYSPVKKQFDPNLKEYKARFLKSLFSIEDQYKVYGDSRELRSHFFLTPPVTSFRFFYLSRVRSVLSTILASRIKNSF